MEELSQEIPYTNSDNSYPHTSRVEIPVIQSVGKHNMPVKLSDEKSGSFIPMTMRPPSYQPSPMRFKNDINGAFVPMSGTNPIRGMMTSVYPNVCSQYGSSSIQLQPADYYGGSNWCEVGILMNNHQQPNSIYGLESRFIGNSWEFRARDALVNLYIYLQTIGNGPYGAYRSNDKVVIPGKEGVWTIQIQTQQQPYLLYVPI